MAGKHRWVSVFLMAVFLTACGDPVEFPYKELYVQVYGQVLTAAGEPVPNQLLYLVSDFYRQCPASDRGVKGTVSTIGRQGARTGSLGMYSAVVSLPETSDGPVSCVRATIYADDAKDLKRPIVSVSSSAVQFGDTNRASPSDSVRIDIVLPPGS